MILSHEVPLREGSEGIRQLLMGTLRCPAAEGGRTVGLEEGPHAQIIVFFTGLYRYFLP